MKHLWKTVAIAAALAATSLVATARAADNELPADVIAAAKKEGKIVFYTSFLGAAYRFRLPSTGTVPHALIQLFDTEREAFEAIARKLE